MKNSLKTLMQKLPDGIDGAIITSDLNRRYFTDMKSSAGTLLLTKTAAHFIIDFRYIEKAKEIITDFDVVLQSDDVYKQIADFFAASNAKNIAVESDFVTVQSYNKYCDKLEGLHISNDNSLSDIISELRSFKSSEEVEYMRKAQDITDKAFLHICDFIKVGQTELDIAIELEYTMKKLGANGLSFDSIIVSGVNSSLPHGVPSDKKIEQGDFITMDFGASYNGYCSDMTRTVAIGKISDEQQKVYDTVLNAQLMAIDAIKVGAKYSEVDNVARSYIYGQGYEGCFGHGLGHSLGLYIHEDPRFSYSCHEILKPNVMMTVEPGVYLSGKFGVRIEDMVLITENGVEIITKSEKKLITL